MIFREMKLEEAEKISTIDAFCFIKNAWRQVGGTLRLVEINWTDKELPNGLPWHIGRFCETIRSGGTALGCFEGETLVGYATVNAQRFGSSASYVLLDQLFVSRSDRGRGIGRQLLTLCRAQAARLGADKLYICAASSEDTIAFYRRCGCVDAAEVNAALAAEDEQDVQLEIHI